MRVEWTRNHFDNEEGEVSSRSIFYRREKGYSDQADRQSTIQCQLPCVGERKAIIASLIGHAFTCEPA